jgi:hypothetical protein
MVKERFDVVASSLSSYFGVGFNTVEEQIQYDLGNEENIFDDDAQDRMDLGNFMEDACMNYFENKMGIKIDSRNSEMAYACDGLLKCKRDGRTFIEGVETGWENKYSNAASCFIDDLGYQIQCQAYMMAFGLSQWVLAGMWQGKPVYKLVKEDLELQNDICTIVEAVSSILMGLSDMSDYPWDIVHKYSQQNELITLNDDDLTDYDRNLLKSLGRLKEQIKELETKHDELLAYAKQKFTDSKYEDDDYKYTVYSSGGKLSLDKNALAIDNPTLDIAKYMVKGNSYTVFKATPKKKEGKK